MQFFVIFPSPFKTNFGIVPQLGYGCSFQILSSKINHEYIILTYLFLKFKLRAIIWILTVTHFFCPLHFLRFLPSICLFLYPLSPRYPIWGVLCNRNFWLVPLFFFLIFSFAFQCSPPPPNHLVCSFVPLVSAALGNSFDFCGSSGGERVGQRTYKEFFLFLSSGSILSYGEVVSDLSKWLTNWVNPLNFNVWIHTIVLSSVRGLFKWNPFSDETEWQHVAALWTDSAHGTSVFNRVTLFPFPLTRPFCYTAGVSCTPATCRIW
jgi:hypothetical protein